MFDLNGAIAAWRDELKRNGVRRREILDELESHLREEVEQLTAESGDAEAAFQETVRRLGEGRELKAEFDKSARWSGRLLRLIGGGILNMDEDGWRGLRPGRLTTAFMIYIAFILTGWGGIVLGDTTVYTLLARSVRNVAFASLVLGAAASTLWLVIKLFHKFINRQAAINPKRAFIALSIIALLPFFGVSLLSALFVVPYRIADWMTPEANQVVRRVASPNGEWEAYVIARPALDGPDRFCYVRRAGGKSNRRVTQLYVDRALNGNQSIQWSPRSDTVVFINGFDLTAVRPEDMATAIIPLRGVKKIKPDGSLELDYRLLREIGKVVFPRPGVVGYQIQGTHEMKFIPENAYRRGFPRDVGYADLCIANRK